MWFIQNNLIRYGKYFGYDHGAFMTREEQKLSFIHLHITALSNVLQLSKANRDVVAYTGIHFTHISNGSSSLFP